ncbi:MAG: hypothetical protein JSR21_20485 [Proteobacteria bacterium]|nr:hypothetical protein [Pseudomonadota bacterium]
MLLLTGVLEGLLTIGVDLSEIIGARAITEVAKGRTRNVEAWVRLARLMQRMALLCLWLEEGNRPPRLGGVAAARLGDVAAAPPAGRAPPDPPAPASPATDAAPPEPGVAASDAPRRQRSGDRWYARMRAEFARRPIEEFLARLRLALSDAARRAGVPEVMERVEELLDRARGLLAAMPAGGRTPKGWRTQPHVAADPCNAEPLQTRWDGAAFCA